MNSLVKTFTVDDWTVIDDGDEPRVSAFEIARRTGSSSVREVKRLIERNRAELEMHGPLPMRVTVTRIEKTGAIRAVEFREVETPMLNELQSVHLVALMRGPLASALRVALVKLFFDVRHGETSAPALNGTVANSARVRDDPTALDKLRYEVRCVCALRGYSAQRVYGFIRRTQRVSSPFDLSLHLLGHVLSGLQNIAKGHVHLGKLLPAGPVRQLPLWSTEH